MEKSWDLNGKTFREPLTTPVVKDRVSATISHLPAKIIAKAAGSSLKTAENARRGMNAMSLANFLNACRAIPELRALAIELMGIEIESDPDFERGLSMLVNAVARRANQE